MFRRCSRIFSFTSEARRGKDNLWTSVERRNRRCGEINNVWIWNFFPKEHRKLYSHLIFLFLLFALSSFLPYFPFSRIFPPSFLCDKWSHRRMPCWRTASSQILVAISRQVVTCFPVLFFFFSNLLAGWYVACFIMTTSDVQIKPSSPTDPRLLPLPGHSTHGFICTRQPA